jgi:acetyl-CoA/propionyl-CoA carboxylase biotin carboxyl carrier protein
MFTRVLVANRGEIAVRVIRTLRDMGIESVAIFSDADRDGSHVRQADRAIRVGPTPAAESYLDVAAVIDAAVAVGADAIHPGYGFLSENPDFASACADAGIVFIGPPVTAIQTMGDKIAAKNKVAMAGIRVVPGSHGTNLTDAQVIEAVSVVGFPALLKPSAGGGGKGMRIVRAGDDVAQAVVGARREAARSFGDETLLVERLIDNPRHIEVQVLADTHGNVVHLGERECSLQRRHQKVIEEAPSPFVDEQTRTRIGQSAIDVAKSCGYVGVGTVEFIVSGSNPEEYFFLEMNTRLQVEHPVTEMITGIDLVREQLRVAAGERLTLRQADLSIRGHAVEARVYAEDPAVGFLPSIGKLLLVAEPGSDPDRPRSPDPSMRAQGDAPMAVGPRNGIRVDSGVETGDVVGSHYDPMLAKIIVHGDSRSEALDTLDGALADTAYLGVTTNVGYLRDILADPRVRNGELHTGMLAEIRVSETFGSNPPQGADAQASGGRTRAGNMVLAAAGLEKLARLARGADGRARLGQHVPTDDPWQIADGWRLREPVWVATMMNPSFGDATEVVTQGVPSHARVRVGEGEELDGTVEVCGSQLFVQLGDGRNEYRFARENDELWLSAGGRAVRITETDQLESEREHEAVAGLGPVLSPMPGSVIAVHVKPGEFVAAGGLLVTVEAMKMEHSLVASADAQVADVLVEVGQQVAMGENLVMMESAPESDLAGDLR